MAQTIHGSGLLIRLPNRTFTRTEKGLAQVTRSYACQTSLASTFRSNFAIGNTLPGETGFIIKYGYTETKREDGFTQFDVTAAGPDPTAPNGGKGLQVQDERLVQTFPSGLVRVDRIYTCSATEVAKHRLQFSSGNVMPLDDGAPAIDGLYVFPEAQEIVRDDNTAEFRASGYGRINTTGQRRFEFVQGETRIFSSVLSGGVGTTSETSIDTLNQALVQTFVTPTNEPFVVDLGLQIDDLEVYMPSGKRLQEEYINGIKFIGNTSVNTRSYVEPIFGGVTTQNFGLWTEITINYVALGRVSIISITTS